MTRVYERDTDALFLRLFRTDNAFVKRFLEVALGSVSPSRAISASAQTKHRGNSGSIDLELSLGNDFVLLIENKIDAGYSTTRAGLGQAERYAESVRTLRASGSRAKSILLAPRVYRLATKAVEVFDTYVDYEDLRSSLESDDLALLDAAISQASTPYEPEQNLATADFFLAYEKFTARQYPRLVLKHNPNSGGVRPTGSHTIYFNVAKTLRLHRGVPKPRMSIQCWDSGAPSASVKIMIGKWGNFHRELDMPQSLVDIGAYLRPAGQSLGLVIDTPSMDTQISVDAQLEEVSEGLEGALRLQDWWNSNAEILRYWGVKISTLS